MSQKCPKCLGTGEVQDQEELGHAMWRLRNSRGYKLWAVAKEMGITASHLSYLESGKRSWNPDLIRKYKDALK